MIEGDGFVSAEELDRWEAQEKFDKLHPEVMDALMQAFEDDGGCGHDLGFGALAIVKAWEKIRTHELVKDLVRL